jgi:hypothetical protein
MLLRVACTSKSSNQSLPAERGRHAPLWRRSRKQVVLEQGRELERRSSPRLGRWSKNSNVKPPSMIPGVACASSPRAPDQNLPTERGQQALVWRPMRKQVVLKQGRGQELKHPVHCRLPVVLDLIQRLKTISYKYWWLEGSPGRKLRRSSASASLRGL